MSQQGWNELAADFENAVCDITAASGDQIARLVESVRPSRRQTLVDAGCGIGTFVNRFGDRFRRVVAFDVAQTMVARARRRCRQIAHAEWHTCALEDAADRFAQLGHLTVCLNVITSPEKALRRRQWDSLTRLVRPGGSLLVVVPSVESARFVAQQDCDAFNGSVSDTHDLVRRRDTRQKHYSRRLLRRRLTERGLKVMSLGKIHYPWEEDGLEPAGRRTPWDWGCVARKPVREN